MSLRLKTTEALARGIISKEVAEQIDKAAKNQRQKFGASVAATSKASSGVSAVLERKPKELDNEIPQRRLFDALSCALPGVPQWEVCGLIPGRRYRADIFLPPTIVVELDGFAFHRSKSAFQADRMRSNLFTAHGYRMFHAFVGQVMCDERLGELVDLIITAHRIP